MQKMNEQMDILFKKITENLPPKYAWMAKEKGCRESLQCDGMNPESYGQMIPQRNWRIVWRNNSATIVCVGKFGRIEKANFKF